MASVMQCDTDSVHILDPVQLQDRVYIGIREAAGATGQIATDSSEKNVPLSLHWWEQQQHVFSGIRQKNNAEQHRLELESTRVWQ